MDRRLAVSIGCAETASGRPLRADATWRRLCLPVCAECAGRIRPAAWLPALDCGSPELGPRVAALGLLGVPGAQLGAAKLHGAILKAQLGAVRARAAAAAVAVAGYTNSVWSLSFCCAVPGTQRVPGRARH